MENYGARSNLGLVAFGMGLPALLLGWLPFIGYLCFPVAVIAIVVGVKALKLDGKGVHADRGLAMAGISMSGIVILFNIFWTYFWLFI